MAEKNSIVDEPGQRLKIILVGNAPESRAPTSMGGLWGTKDVWGRHLQICMPRTSIIMVIALGYHIAV